MFVYSTQLSSCNFGVQTKNSMDVSSFEGALKQSIKCRYVIHVAIHILLFGRSMHTSTFKGVPNGSSGVSIHHPLGFNWHPFEGAGIYIYILFILYYIYYIYYILYTSYFLAGDPCQKKKRHIGIHWKSIGKTFILWGF